MAGASAEAWPADANDRSDLGPHVGFEETMRSIPEEKITCRNVSFAVFVWAPWIIAVSLTFIFFFALQQLLALPFRPFRGRPLTFVLEVTAPIVTTLLCLFVTQSYCEPCYGRDLQTCETVDDFLSSCSASRRKNINRNLRKAHETLKTKNIEATIHKAGTWRCSREIRQLIWNQCKSHHGQTFASGSTAILTCYRPMSPWLIYCVEMVFVLAFPNDAQVFRDSTGRIVSLNTQARVRNQYFNPTYATVPEHSKDGIYAVSNRRILEEALRTRSTVLNVMPSMRRAKGQLGLRVLPFRAIIKSGLSLSKRQPQAAPAVTCKEPVALATVQEVAPMTIGAPAKAQPAGGKRAARKRAEAAAKKAAAGEIFSSENVKLLEGYEGTEKKGKHSPSIGSASTTVSPSSTVPRAESSSDFESPGSTEGVAQKVPVVLQGGKRAARKRAEAEAAAARALQEGGAAGDAAPAVLPPAKAPSEGPKGGKRAARKRAAAEAAAAAEVAAAEQAEEAKALTRKPPTAELAAVQAEPQDVTLQNVDPADDGSNAPQGGEVKVSIPDETE